MTSPVYVSPEIPVVRVAVFTLVVADETATIMSVSTKLCCPESLTVLHAALSMMRDRGADLDAEQADECQLWPGAVVLLDRDATAATGVPVWGVVADDEVDTWRSGGRLIEAIRTVGATEYLEWRRALS